MRFAAWIFIIVSAILLANCSAESGDLVFKDMMPEAPIEFGMGDCVTFHDGERLCLDSVANDSRCPTDLVCIWGGNAEVYLSLEAVDGKQHLLKLNTASSLSFPSDTTIADIKVDLIALNPYPETDSIPIKQDDYSVMIMLSNP